MNLQGWYEITVSLERESFIDFISRQVWYCIADRRICTCLL